MHDAHLEHSCTFRIADTCFAVPAAHVVEVLRAGTVTRVPLAGEAVLGLVHLRGRIVPVVDPAVVIGLERRTAGSGHLVLDLDDDWYGLVIDEMLDMVAIPAAGIERPTAAAEGGGDVIDGVFASPGRLVHLLNPRRMIQSIARQRAVLPPRSGTSHGNEH